MGHIYIYPPKRHYLLKGLGAIFLGSAIGYFFSREGAPDAVIAADQGVRVAEVVPARAASPLPSVVSHQNTQQPARDRSDPETCADLREAETYWREAHNTGLTAVERHDAYGNFLLAELFLEEGMRVTSHSRKYLNDLGASYALPAIHELTLQLSTQSNPVEKFLTMKKLEKAFNHFFVVQDPVGNIVQIFGMQPSNPEYLKQMTGWSPAEVKKTLLDVRDSMIQDMALLIKSPDHAAAFDSRPDAASKKIELLKSMDWDLELTRVESDTGRESMGDLFRKHGVSLEQVGRYFEGIETLRKERDMLKKKDNDALRLTPC